MRAIIINEESILVKSVRDGNDEALRKIYNKHFEMLSKYVMKNGGSRDDACDAYQETMMVFYRKVCKDSFELTSRISTLLYGICRIIWLNMYNQKLKIEKHIEFYKSEELNLEEDVIENDRIKNVLEALIKLGEPCKTILKDYYFNGLTMKEIANKIGYTNADNAKNQKYKCTLRLKKIIGNNRL